MKTARLCLRSWKATDLQAMTAMHQDDQVIKYLLGPLNTEQCASLIERFQAHLTHHSWGIWAVEHEADGQLIGMAGLNQPRCHIQSDRQDLEIMWRFRSEYWGQGYATEAAKHILAFAFNQLKQEQIIAFTHIHNQASIALMQRLGMSYVHDFLHPLLPQEHPLVKHALYRLINPSLIEK